MNATAARKNVVARLREWSELLGFALRHGGSLMASLELFYLIAVKRSLAYRGLAKFKPKTIRHILFKTGGCQTLKVSVRDNGVDANMLAEFFHHKRLAKVEVISPKPQAICDLGANIGIASLFLATACPGAYVYAFEPEPSNFEVCSLNFANLSRARAFQCAIGARTGVMTFAVDNRNLRGGHLLDSPSGQGSSDEQRTEVQVWSLADWVTAQRVLPPDFLKVDVEGAEFDVLQGLGNCAKTIMQIHLETHSPELRDKCVGWLKANGFSIEEELHYTHGLGTLWAKRPQGGRPV